MTDTFTAITHCPRCNTIAVHPLREPNPDPPKQIHPPDTTQIIAWGGQVIVDENDDGLDRWDERPYEIIRTCARCGHEWGQQ